MPPNTRQWARRKLEQAKNSLDWTGKHIYEVREVYQTEHPEIGDPLMTSLEILAEVDNLLEAVRNKI